MLFDVAERLRRRFKPRAMQVVPRLVINEEHIRVPEFARLPRLSNHLVGRGALISQPRCCSKAFTLVEVLVVLVILGLAGAIVVPALSRPSNFAVQAAGRMLISDIMIAQNDAIASQLPRSVVFEPLLNRYRLVDEDGNTLQAVWRAGSGMDSSAYTVDFNADRRFTGVTLQNVNIGGAQTLAFDPLGSPANGGTLDLVSNNTTYRVSISPFIGRVTIAIVP